MRNHLAVCFKYRQFTKTHNISNSITRAPKPSKPSQPSQISIEEFTPAMQREGDRCFAELYKEIPSILTSESFKVLLESGNSGYKFPTKETIFNILREEEGGQVNNGSQSDED
jgi:hypothetical protein